jgi:phage terminase large subunit-like protein
LPGGVASAALGDAAVELAASAGLVLDEWQQHVLRKSLGVRKDGKWAASAVCLIVPRQNGKGAILEALTLAHLFLLGSALVIWTAHEMKTAKAGFQRLVDLVTTTPDLRRQVRGGNKRDPDGIRRGNDDRGIELESGGKVQFLARSTGSGRGFTGDLVIFDEAYELKSEAIAALAPTLLTVPNPQIWYTSSAPMETSEQLHIVRKRGIAGADSRLAFFEWSCEPGSDLQSPKTWARANPAYPYRIDDDAIEMMWTEMSADHDPAKFGREVCGIPDEAEEDHTVIPMDVWNADAPDGLRDKNSKIASHRKFALDVAPDRAWASYGVAGRRADGRPHVENVDRRPFTGWVVERGVELFEKWRIPIRIEATSPAGSFIDRLRERGVEVEEVSAQDHAKATGQIIDDALNGQLRHLGQTSLEAALQGAVLRASGDVQLWGRRASKVDITPLVAVTIALGGVPEVEHAFSGGFSSLDDFVEG